MEGSKGVTPRIPRRLWRLAHDTKKVPRRLRRVVHNTENVRGRPRRAVQKTRKPFLVCMKFLINVHALKKAFKRLLKGF